MYGINKNKRKWNGKEKHNEKKKRRKKITGEAKKNI